MYSKLNESQRQIRLLHLCPATQDATLSCTFSLASLNDNPTFEALSYTWGNESDAKAQLTQIRVHDESWPITANLYNALRNLQPRDGAERVLWVDAVCINQDDVDEKSWQVAIMDDIYKHASNVIAYLGEDFEDCNLAIEVIQQLASDLNLHLYKYMDHGLAVRGLGCESTRVLQCLETFFSSPWITRAWTCQEYLVTETLHFQYGRATVPKEKLYKAYSNYATHSSSCCRPSVQQRTRDESDLPDEDVRRRWLDARLHWVGMLTVQRDREVWIRGNRSSLLVLEQFRSREARDPRDYVYSMLGLGHADWGREMRPVDYSLSLDGVFKRAAEADLRTRKRLDFLVICGEAKARLSTTLRMPSWVPDWSGRMGRDVIIHAGRIEKRMSHDACNGRLAKDATISGNELIVHGVRFSTVSTYTEAQTYEDIGERIRTFKAIEMLQEIPHILVSAEDRPRDFETIMGAMRQPLSAILLTFIAGWDLHPQTGQWTAVDIPRNEVAFRAWEEIMKAEDPDATYDFLQAQFAQEMHHLDVLLMSGTQGRRFVILQGGHIGLAPAACERGDEVVFLEGGPVPFVLRRLPGEEKYTYIGDAYVNGFMRGEAFVNVKDDDRLERFVIV